MRVPGPLTGMVPTPNVPFTPNSLQQGEDAVAVYQTVPSTFKIVAPASGLVRAHSGLPVHAEHAAVALIGAAGALDGIGVISPDLRILYWNKRVLEMYKWLRVADVSDGMDVEVAGTRLTVLHTPGHAPGAVCLYASARAQRAPGGCRSVTGNQ